jgi:hypothetical protein
MIIGRDGLCLDFHSGNFVGLDPSLPFDVMTRNFEAMAAAAKAQAITETEEATAPDDSVQNDSVPVEATETTLPEASELRDENAGSLLDRLENIAKHHLIFKWTSVDPTEDISRVVSSANISELKPSLLQTMPHSVLISLHLHGLATCVIVGDGAKENVKVFDVVASEAIGQYIPETLREEYNSAMRELGLFDRNFVILHPCTQEPIFLLEDMPHVVKRVVNAMEKSSMAPDQRDLRWKDNPMNLSMIRQVWELIGGQTTSLQATKFTTRHFFKDQNDRMRCSLSFQIVSRSSYYMIKDALDDQ